MRFFNYLSTRVIWRWLIKCSFLKVFYIFNWVLLIIKNSTNRHELDYRLWRFLLLIYPIALWRIQMIQYNVTANLTIIFILPCSDLGEWAFPFSDHHHLWMHIKTSSLYIFLLLELPVLRSELFSYHTDSIEGILNCWITTRARTVYISVPFEVQTNNERRWITWP